AEATDNEGATTASAAININVVSNQPPSVALIAPTNGQSFVTPVDIPISSQATDSDGFISRVEFFAETNKLGEVTNPDLSGFTLIWSNAPQGTFNLKATAFDNWRGSNTSAVVAITVSNPPPVVSLMSPM